MGGAEEADTPEKCATLGIIRGRGPQAARSVATEGFKGNLPLVPWGVQGDCSLPVKDREGSRSDFFRSICLLRLNMTARTRKEAASVADVGEIEGMAGDGFAGGGAKGHG